MAAWADPATRPKPVRAKSKRTKSHLRNLADDLRLMAREAARKERLT